MVLRLVALRRFCSKPVPLGLPSSSTESLKASMGKVKNFSFSKFFEEKHFWEKANVGPFFLLLFFTPTIYRSAKDAYWTRQLRQLNTEEVIADRYEWLRVQMIRDEVEEQLLKQVPRAGVTPLELGPSMP